MANASFHAKITADARQFIQQVEEASEALKQLSRAEEKAAGGTSAAGQQSSKKRQEQKKTQQESMAAADRLHRETMDNIAEEGRARQKAQASTGPGSMGFPNQQSKTADLAKEIAGTKKLQLQREQEIAKQNRIQNDAMVTGRYALYDMANVYRGIAESAFRVAQATAQTLVTAAQFETAFTAVERAATLEVGSDMFEEVKDSLIALSTEIPVAFDQISEIATLGAQMGVATGDLAGFTETIAQFAAVTGNSIDDTAEKFGRLSALANVPTDEFENLASSVVFAGFNAVATEKEILKMSESIVAAAANSGYAGDQVVGLATALSSLGVPPERARGAIQELFSEMNRSVEGTSDKITMFADLMGLTESSAKSLFKSNPEQFFTNFLSGLSEVENLTVVLDEFGLKNRRTVDVIQRLSGNMDVYSKSIREASESYAAGTALAEVYGDTQDNLEAKVQRLINAFDALQAVAAGGFAEALKPIVEGLISMTKAATEFADSGLGQSIIPIITLGAGLVAAFAGVRFVTSIATAQLLAMRVAVLKMGQVGNMATKPFTNLTRAITGNMFAVTELGGATQYLSAQQVQAAVTSGKLTKAQGRNILATKQATVATRGLSIAMSGLGLAMGGALAIGIGAMVYELTRFNIDLSETGAGAASLADAIAKDTKAFDDGAGAIATHTNKLNVNKNSSLDSREAANLVADSQGKISESFIDTTEKIEENTFALGENYRQLMANALVESDAFQKFYDDAAEEGLNVIEVTEQVGLGFNDLIESAAQDPGTGALDSLLDKAREFEEAYEGDISFAQFDESLTEGERALGALANVISGTDTSAENLGDSVKYSIDVMSRDDGVRGFIARMFKVAEALDNTTAKSLVMAELNEYLNTGAGEAGDFADGIEDADKALGGMSKTIRTVLDYSDDLGGIFDRIMGIELGEAEALDAVANGWEKIRESADKRKTQFVMPMLR